MDEPVRSDNSNDRGERISTTPGPVWLYMRGCVDCHGVKGPGRVPVIMGEAIPTDITYEALVQEEHGEEEHEAHPPALMRRSDRYSGRCEPCRETAGSHHARVADVRQGLG